MILAALLSPLSSLCQRLFLSFALTVGPCLIIWQLRHYLVQEAPLLSVYFQCAGDATVTSTSVDCPAGIQSLDSTQLASSFTLDNWVTIVGLFVLMWAIIFVCIQCKNIINAL